MEGKARSNIYDAIRGEKSQFIPNQAVEDLIPNSKKGDRVLRPLAPVRKSEKKKEGGRKICTLSSSRGEKRSATPPQEEHLSERKEELCCPFERHLGMDPPAPARKKVLLKKKSLYHCPKKERQPPPAQARGKEKKSLSPNPVSSENAFQHGGEKEKGGLTSPHAEKDSRLRPRRKGVGRDRVKRERKKKRRSSPIRPR